MAAAARSAALAALLASDSAAFQPQHQHRHRPSFPFSSLLGRRFSRNLSFRPSLEGFHGSRMVSWSSPVNEVAVVDGSTNAAPLATSKPDIILKDEAPEEVLEQDKEASISAVMADVANLVKLVDSRDIVELELKHLDYELIIRKKEALPPPPAVPTFAPTPIMGHSPYPVYSPPPPPAAAPLAADPVPAPAVAAPPAPAAPPALSLPRLLSPMAGTFYRSPAPGEGPFVKVGDKVQKGQVICIVEAMKLMNEIEADQSGTIVELLAEDGKPVSVDTPLFAIKP